MDEDVIDADTVFLADFLPAWCRSDQISLHPLWTWSSLAHNDECESLAFCVEFDTE